MIAATNACLSRPSILAVAAATLAGVLAGGAAHATGEGLERSTIDARFKVRGPRPPDGRVVLVALDNNSLTRLDARPPVARKVQARLVDRLNRAGAAVVAFDFSLEQSTDDQRQDRQLALALLDSRHAVISVAAPSADGEVAGISGRYPFPDAFVRPGFTLLPQDGDGVVRRFVSRRGELDGFAVAVADVSSGRRLRVPSRALIDFPGPPRTFSRVSYVDVLTGRVLDRELRGKIVVVGPTASVLGDVHRVPVDRGMPGIEVHAAAIATALAGFPLRTVTQGVTSLTTTLLALLVPFLTLAAARTTRLLRGPVGLSAPAPLESCLAGTLVVVGWLVAAQLLFDHGTVVEFIPGLVAAVASTTAATSCALILSSRERRAVRVRFAARDLGTVQRTLTAERRRRVVDAAGIIPGYEIVEKIGAGAMGDVYLAKQSKLGRDVALKLITTDEAVRPRYRQQFVREAHRAAAVVHPNIIPVLDAGDAGGVLFIAMPFVASTTLAEWIKPTERLPPDFVVQLLHRVACALDAAYDEQGLIHADVKPANVLVPNRAPHSPYVIDFGVSRTSKGTADDRGGTAAYFAPERFHGEPGRPADVFALAVTLFEALAGHRPDAGADSSVTASRQGLPEGLDAVLRRGLAPDPRDRYDTAQALTEAAAQALKITVVSDVERQPANESTPTTPPSNLETDFE